jgi:hypothetical protein
VQRTGQRRKGREEDIYASGELLYRSEFVSV